jgi:hypothetical protein
MLSHNTKVNPYETFACLTAMFDGVCSGSPVAAPILSAALHADFIRPLSKRMSGADAEARAALITAYVLGFALMRATLGSPAIERTEPDLIAAKLGQAI